MQNSIITVATPISLASMNADQLNDLRSQIGHDAMERLIEVDEARQARQEAAAKQEPRVVVLTLEQRRENLANNCGEEFPPIAQALRGELEPEDAADLLSDALLDPMIQKVFSGPSLDVMEEVRNRARFAQVQEEQAAADRVKQERKVFLEQREAKKAKDQADYRRRYQGAFGKSRK